jgi:hypothetical protein
MDPFGNGCRALVGACAEESFEEPGLAGPGGQQYLAGDLAAGVAQGERDDNDVVERADDRDELGDQVNRAGQPDPGDDDGDPRPSRYPRVIAETSDGGDAVGDERGEIAQDAWG